MTLLLFVIFTCVRSAIASKAALDTVHSRQLADGTPAMSFTRLLAHMATIVRSDVHAHDPAQSQAATGLRPHRRDHRGDRSDHAASISTD